MISDGRPLEPPAAHGLAQGSPIDLRTFWNLTPESLCAELRCGLEGLTSADARTRLAQYGPNSDAQGKRDGLARAVLRRLLEPLSLILLVAGLVSLVTGDAVGGAIIVAILGISITYSAPSKPPVSRTPRHLTKPAAHA